MVYTVGWEYMVVHIVHVGVGWETDTWYPDRRIGDGMPGIEQGTPNCALLLSCGRVG